MKKIPVIFILLLTVASAVSSAPAEEEMLTGNWTADTMIAEMEDGLLVASEAPYSWPYLGIREINILDSGFILLRTDQGEHRAFYEIQKLDYDNIHLLCTFKSGEQLLIKLVKLDNDLLRFFCRISADSELAFSADKMPEAETNDEEESSGDTEAVNEASEDDGADIEKIPESLYTGFLRRKK